MCILKSFRGGFSLQPIQVDEIPEEIREFLKKLDSIKFPRQGYTSNVAIIRNHQGSFALKRTKGDWYCSLLKKEVSVLNCLTKETKLLIPKVKLFVEQKQNRQCWALFEYIQGETVRIALKDEKNKETRQETIFNFGKFLADIHSTPCPNELIHNKNWLGQMISQARNNLINNEVDGTKELLEKVEKNKPDNYKQTLIHGDYTIDNVLVFNREITGVIDWGSGAYGDPRYDVSLAIRPKPNVFEKEIEKQIFFEGYGENIIDDKIYEYFVNGLYEFF